ncbi:hypothetical protein PUH89_01565 [Rhodobacter capsulatus]|nr:hypothetical protein [Rhodobacter capsulatus]WER09694.1 hypothetical protein PUH89_01565 [Rhodobacter capsulatus]
MLKAVSALILCLGLAGCRDAMTITWQAPETGVSLVMTLRPLLSLQSDWERTLTLSTPRGSISLDLLTDTGWWQGSNLYAGAPGVWMLDEGQADCIVIEVDPAKLEWTSCTAKAAAAGAASRKFQDYRYLGYFSERDRDAGPRFMDATERAEQPLPDGM